MDRAFLAFHARDRRAQCLKDKPRGRGQLNSPGLPVMGMNSGAAAALATPRAPNPAHRPFMMRAMCVRSSFFLCKPSIAGRSIAADPLLSSAGSMAGGLWLLDPEGKRSTGRAWTTQTVKLVISNAANDLMGPSHAAAVSATAEANYSSTSANAAAAAGR